MIDQMQEQAIQEIEFEYYRPILNNLDLEEQINLPQTEREPVYQPKEYQE